MRATIIHGAGDIRVETVPDPKILEPTDTLVRVVRASICGSTARMHKNVSRTCTANMRSKSAGRRSTKRA